MEPLTIPERTFVEQACRARTVRPSVALIPLIVACLVAALYVVADASDFSHGMVTATQFRKDIGFWSVVVALFLSFWEYNRYRYRSISVLRKLTSAA